MCLSGAQRRIHDGETVPEGKKEVWGYTLPSSRTQTHTKQLNLSWLRPSAQNRVEEERDKGNHRQHYNSNKDITFLSSSCVLNFPLSSCTIIIHYTCLFLGKSQLSLILSHLLSIGCAFWGKLPTLTGLCMNNTFEGLSILMLGNMSAERQLLKMYCLSFSAHYRSAKSHVWNPAPDVRLCAPLREMNG